MLFFWVLHREDTGIEKSKKISIFDFLIFWIFDFWARGKENPIFQNIGDPQGKQRRGEGVRNALRKEDGFLAESLDSS